MLLGLCFAVIAFIVDQLSKLYVMGLFGTHASSFAFGRYFNLVEAWNTGVSFSMFDGHGELGKFVLIGFALIVVIFLLHWLKGEQNKLAQASLGLIIGGALGNVFDRVCYGAVFDFLDFHYGTLHWPAFNLADTFICIGAFLILVSSLLDRRKISLKDSVK